MLLRLVTIAALTAAWQRFDEHDARNDIVAAHARGDANRVAELAQHELELRGEDNQQPSLHHYLGWARFQRGDLAGARDAFLAAVEATFGGACVCANRDAAAVRLHDAPRLLHGRRRVELVGS